MVDDQQARAFVAGSSSLAGSVDAILPLAAHRNQCADLAGAAFVQLVDVRHLSSSNLAASLVVIFLRFHLEPREFNYSQQLRRSGMGCLRPKHSRVRVEGLENPVRCGPA